MTKTNNIFFLISPSGHERLLVDDQRHLYDSISNLKNKTDSRKVWNRRAKEVERFRPANEPDVPFQVC